MARPAVLMMAQPWRNILNERKDEKGTSFDLQSDELKNAKRTFNRYNRIRTCFDPVCVPSS